MTAEFAALQDRGDHSRKDGHVGILFPENSEQPKTVFVAGNFPYLRPDHVGYPAERYILQYNPVRSYALDHTILIVYREDFLSGGSAVNKSILSVTDKNTRWEWRGPVLAVRHNGPYSDGAPDDIALADLRHVTDFLTWYGSRRPVNTGALTTKSVSPVIPAFKVACLAEQQECQAKPVMDVKLPFDYKFRTVATKSSIAQRLGLSLTFYKVQVKPDIRAMCGGPFKEGMTYAMSDVDPESETWGQSPSQWGQGDFHDCIVRKDQEGLTSQHVEAFLHFCQSELPILFEGSKDETVASWTRGEALQFINKVNFGVFSEEYRRSKIDQLTRENDHDKRAWELVECPTRV